MGKTRQQRRVETIEVLNNLKEREIQENKRLKRKKEILEEQTKETTFTLIGTIEEIEVELTRIKREKKQNELKKEKLVNQIVITWKHYLNYNKTIQRLQQMTYMEEDIDFYYWYLHQTNVLIQPSKKKFTIPSSSDLKDPLLLDILELPIEIMNHIQSYLSYENLYSLLENRYNPLKMINKFQSKALKLLIHHLFQPIFLDILEEETKEMMIAKFKTFYNGSNDEERIKRNVYDERVFLKNIILTLKPKDPMIFYKMYQFIVILYKIMFGLDQFKK